MFKFIISMLVMLMFSVPAMAQDMKTVDLPGSGTPGMRYSVPLEWKQGKILGMVTWSDQGASRFHTNLNWQALPLEAGEVITKAEIMKGLEILETHDLQIEETTPGKDFSISYTIEKGGLEILFMQRCYVLEDVLLIGTLTSLSSNEEESRQLWKQLQELTPAPAPKEGDSVSVEIQIEDIRDLLQVKENKLQRLVLLDRSADREVREALTEELELLGLQLRKLERQQMRNIRNAFNMDEISLRLHKLSRGK